MDGATFRLREPTIDDLDALVELEQASFASDRLSRRSWRRIIGSGQNFSVVATDADGLIGAIAVLVRADSRAGRIYSIAVAERARNRGVARALVRQAGDRARSKNLTSLRLEVRADNTAAIALYERLGFAHTGRKKAYYADGMDAIRMARSLPLED